MVISEFIHTEMTDTNMINDSYERSSQRIYALLRLRRGVWPADWLKLQLIIAIWCVALAADGATGQEISSCCDKATGSCRTVCEKMSLVEIASDPILREDRVSNIYKFCPSELTEFWVCMNDTLQESRGGSGWWGRSCCAAARGATCARACSLAAHAQVARAACRASDELDFLQCLRRQDDAQSCCMQTQSDACYDACAAALRDGGGGSRSRALSACADSSPALVHCLRNLTRSTTTTDPAKYLPCCNQSGKPACRESCNRVLRTQTASQDIVDSLQEGGCGLPLPYDAMWQCFLRKDSQADSANNAGNYDRLGIDSAKLHCCQKGTTAHCKKMCFNTFTKDWIDYWERFEAECLKQPTEVNMAMCIDEVEEPCELGCDGLSYCTNFNNRPTELFRSCNARADTAAHYDVATWQTQGYLGLPGLRLPVRNISNCSPNIWKAVACTLQIKPCARQDHFSQICREDCFQLLSQCLDWSRVSGDFTAASLCGKLSNDDEESPCVSLRNFLDPSAQAFTEPRDQVTFPCKGNTCNNSQVCVVNRNCKSASDGCSRYNCQNACALGEASQYMVPSGTYVRIPISNLQRGCLKICQCSVSGNIEKCQPLPCFSYDSCTLPNDKVEHGAQFYMECNLCTCFAGELLCSRRVCEGDGTTSGVITRLPCNCPPHHLPVCGANGNTYPSSCLAKCAGLSDADIEFGACSARDPCVGVTCAEENSMCMPTRTVCLSSMHKPCPQHVCVNTSGCNAQATSPVCDTEGTTHPNPCYLFTSGKQLAYEGECLKGCSKSGQVCGGDGNTYKSECAAWANLINIDYEGPCLAVGPISDKMERKCNLDHISCPPLQKEDCIGFTAPGSCCPRCGGALRILYSKKQIDRALYAIRGHSQISITLRSVLLALQRHVQVAECKVRGHLTIEMDIFVMIGTSVPHPSDLQLNSCQREAEKLSSMIRRQSARIISELNLSALSYAIDVHTFLTNSASLDCDRNFALMVSLVFICVRHLVHLFDS